MKKSSSYKRLSALAFSMILVFGIFMNLRGVVNPLIQQDYKINYSQLGFVLVFFSMGSILATSSSGILIQRFSLKKVFWAGLLIASCGLLTISYVDNYYLLVLVMTVMGVGLGVINISSNSLASRIFTENKGRMMNLFHLFFGVGSFLAPIYANQVFKLGFGWEGTYSFGILIVIVLFLYSLTCEFPQEETEDKESKVSTKELLTHPKVILFIIMFLFHVGSELGVSSWLGVYLDDVQGKSKAEISFYLSTFFALFTIGRFLASIIVEKVGYLRLVLCSVLGAMISILLGLVGPDSFALAFSVSGLFLAINFPTMQAAMFEVFDDDIAAILGLTLTAGGMGNVVFANWLIGFLNDLLGVELGFGIVLIYLLILFSATVYLRYKCLKQEELSVQQI